MDESLGLDCMINRTRFEPVIFGLNDSLVIKQKRNGTAAYQVASTMMEKSSKRAKFDKDHIQSSESLQVYKKISEDGKTIVTEMEILLPHKYKGILNVGEITDDRLLKGIAFRIPTQGLASIESFKVVGFLNESVGDIVVLPSAIVKKAGSDYDIDKLNLSLPNVVNNKIGRPIYLSYNMKYEDYLENTSGTPSAVCNTIFLFSGLLSVFLEISFPFLSVVIIVSPNNIPSTLNINE